MMDADKVVQVAIKGLEKDTPEIMPVLVKIIRFLGHIIPKTLMNFGHREFQRFRQLNNQLKT